MYAKIFSSMYQGTLRGNSRCLLVFTNILAHCDSAGVADIHPKAIAEETGLTVDEVRAALLELASPDVDSRSPEEEGRRITLLDSHRDWGWLVVNHAKYRAIRNAEDRREQNRIAQTKFRKSKPIVSNSKQASAQSAHTDTDTDTNKEGANAPSLSGPVFGEGLEMLISAKVPEKQARTFLGMCVANWEDCDVRDALLSSVGKVDPISYARKVLSTKPKKAKLPDGAGPVLAKIREKYPEARLAKDGQAFYVPGIGIRFSLSGERQATV